MSAASSVATRLTQIRESRKRTQDQLTECSRLPVKLIRSLGNGDLIPSLALLIQIARVLGVRLGTFLDDAEHLGPVVHRNGGRYRSDRPFLSRRMRETVSRGRGGRPRRS